MTETEGWQKMPEVRLLTIEAADSVTHEFERLPPDSRRAVLRDLAARLTDDELALVDELTAQRRQKQFDILGALPSEVQLDIVEHLSIRDFGPCATVCQRWRRLFLSSHNRLEHMVTAVFPLHRDVAARSLQDARSLLQFVQDRVRREAGIFRSRLTTIAPMEVHGRVPTMPLRLQCLRNPSDAIYEDVPCSAVSSIQNWQPSYSRVYYSDGYLACYLPCSMQPVLVQNLRTMETKAYPLPREHLIRGSPLSLMAVGNQLVVGSLGRTLIAWDIATGATAQINLPSMVHDCVTRDDLVLIESTDYTLYAWESLTRLVEIDTSCLEDEELNGSWPPPSMLNRCRDRYHAVPVILHPSDRDRFFVFCRKLDLQSLVVHEFQRKRSGCYALSQTHEYAIPYHEASEEITSYNNRADSRGTFELWRFESLHQGFISSNYERYIAFQSIMFNTLTCTFSVYDYSAPQHPHQGRRADANPRACVACLWEDQVLYCYRVLRRGYRDSWSAFLFAGDRAMLPSTSSPAWKQALGACFWEEMHPMLARPARRDRTDLQDIGRAHNLRDAFYSEYGFRWVSSFPTDPLGFPDEPVDVGKARLGRANKTIHNDYDGSAPEVERIWADEDFVVVATGDTFTVFCADPDRKWANAVAARE